MCYHVIHNSQLTSREFHGEMYQMKKQHQLYLDLILVLTISVKLFKKSGLINLTKFFVEEDGNHILGIGTLKLELISLEKSILSL